MNRRQNGFGVVMMAIVLAVVGAIGVGGWYVWQAQRPAANNTKPPAAPAQNPTDSPTQAGTKTYTNTKYGYSFEYPIEAEIHSDAPFGGQPIPITPESDSATVELLGKRFEIWFTGYSQLTKERVYNNFSGTVSPDEIIVTDIQIGNATGFKVGFKDPTLTGSYYFLQKTIGSSVAMITMSAGLEDILNSFNFK